MAYMDHLMSEKETQDYREPNGASHNKKYFFFKETNLQISLN